jgi:hypothetical protein
MSKKKRTKTQIVMQKKDISHTQLERCYVVAKKVLRHFELEPNLLDSFSKKQKQILLKNIFDVPSIKPEKENTIPRPFIENIRKEVLQFMKTEYFGNPENQLTYMELATYGLGFFMSVFIQNEGGLFTGTPQEEIAQHIYEKFEKEELFKDGFTHVLNEVHFLTRSYSQVNFRLYGFSYDWKPSNSKIRDTTPMQMKIKLTAQNCEWKMFTHNDVERKAYRLIVTAHGIYEPSWAVLRKNKIFPNANEEEYLNIYIQSHVLHRLKERLDLFEPKVRNYFTQFALTYGQLVVSVEKQKLLACLGNKDRPLGYFTFFIQKHDIVVNTFIPLASQNTPEGKKLYELLPLSKEEMTYLGMDKISFYTKIDFEQIPMLKQALIKSGIWETKVELDGMLDVDALEEGETPIDMTKTMFVKSFFDKLEQHRSIDLDIQEQD